jgi:hypothetical protein
MRADIDPLDLLAPPLAWVGSWDDVLQRAGESPRRAAQMPTPQASGHTLPRLIRGHRLALALVAAVVLVGAVIAVAIFPRSPGTSSGLTTISNRGTPTPFVDADKGWGKAYTLAQLGGFVYFRIEKPEGFVVPPGMTNRPTCWGRGKLRGGQIEVLMVDCSAFPSAQTPVLKWVSVVASDRTGGGTLLEVEGIAADGVAEMRLVSQGGQIIAKAPVEGNVFRFEDVTGLGAMGTKLIAVDPSGEEVWSGPG